MHDCAEQDAQYPARGCTYECTDECTDECSTHGPALIRALIRAHMSSLRLRGNGESVRVRAGLVGPLPIPTRAHYHGDARPPLLQLQRCPAACTQEGREPHGCCYSSDRRPLCRHWLLYISESAVTQILTRVAVASPETSVPLGPFEPFRHILAEMLSLKAEASMQRFQMSERNSRLL